MQRPFDYRPSSQSQVDDMQAISNAAQEMYRLMIERIPGSAERTLAIRKLQEARMWANAAILGVRID